VSARVWLTTHEPSWLWERGVPDLMLSRRRLERVKRWRPALADWVLDSGGFTELSMFGRWSISSATYVAFVQRCVDEIGRLVWAAPMDWMCEPFMLERTGQTVVDHQGYTLNNYLVLRMMAPDLPIIPVLQGWQPGDYLRHADAYEAADVDLAALPVVGVGSVCRRQATESIVDVVGPLHDRGYRVHLFGAKASSAHVVAGIAESTDSLAWSFRARQGRVRLPGCTHATCANCVRWAEEWRRRLQQRMDGPWQPRLA